MADDARGDRDQGGATSDDAISPGSTATHDEMLAQYLESQICECPHCRYSLRRLRTTRCPECGNALRLTLTAARPDLRLFMSGLVAFASAFGFAGITFVGVIAYAVVWRWGPGLVNILIFFIMTVLAGAMTISWCKLSRWMLQQRLRTQFALVSAAWLLPLLYPGAYLILVIVG